MKNKKYITIGDYGGLDYKSIAKIMSDDGDKMNHATVRNIVIRGFSKVIKNISKSYDLKYDEKTIKRIAQSPEFQESIIKIIKKSRNNKDEQN